MKEQKQHELENLILELEKFQKEFISSSERILKAGNQLGYALDLFSNAVSNRAIWASGGIRAESYG